ncbi:MULTISPECIES: MFS transporter [Robertmurraya]|uniref:MFS transporter n=1 Tax=Robertmurraya beringensis TaxID=641660 RepID=A0ABV6KPN7_9BACI
MAKQNNLLIFILAIGAFGLINTELGMMGILPFVAEHFNVSVSKAGWLVSLFALVVAISAPIIPLLLSGFNRKKIMLLVLGVFVLGNIVSIFTDNFTIALIARAVPAFFHPAFFSLAFTVAAASVSNEESPKAIAKVFIGVSAGMVIGTPIATFIASSISFPMAMVFNAVVNAVAFIAILVFVPSMPVKERLSYGAQLSVLKRPMVWHSILAAIFINSAITGVYSYFSEYLKTGMNLSPSIITIMLFIYGGANIIGNIVAGKLLTNNAIKTVLAFPFALGAVYIMLFLFGQLTVPMFISTFLWGIVAGAGGNILQYWVVSSAPEAPEFSNGLFLTSGNLGIAVGTAAGGLFISQLGTQYFLLVGFLSLLLCLAFILIRYYMYSPVKQMGNGNFTVERTETM